MLYYCLHLKFTLYPLPLILIKAPTVKYRSPMMSEKSRLEQWKCTVIPEGYRRVSRKETLPISLSCTYQPLVTELWYMLWPSAKTPEVRISACTL